MLTRLTRNLTLQQVLVVICMIAATVGVVVATTGMTVLMVQSYNQSAREQLSAISYIVAENIVAPLQLGYEAEAAQTLKALEQEQAIEYACVLDATNTTLAEYSRKAGLRYDLKSGITENAAIVEPENGMFLDAYRPVMLDGKRIGTVALRYNLSGLRAAARQLISTSVIVTLLSLGLALLLVTRLRHVILQPLYEIVDTAGRIRTESNYSVRARTGYSRQELGVVVDAFNAMLEQIESRDRALRSVNEELEERVAERTGELEQQVEVRREAQEELRRSNESFHNLVNNNSDGIVVVDDVGRIRFMNPAAEGFFGKEATKGELFPWDMPDSDGDARVVNLPREGRTVEFARIQTKWDGEPALLVTVRDITRRRSLESQLLQAQKMEAVGRLAGGVAHDFNNLLTAILGYSDLLLASLPEGSDERADAEVIRRAADRARALTRQLLTFSRREVVQLRVLDVNDVVSDSDRILRRLIGEDVELVTVLGDSKPCVEADPGLLEQVLMNLVVNARDAMERIGGKIVVKVDRLTVSPDEKPFRDAVPGTYVCVSVSDNGCGMPEDVQEKIFEPFFTTKGVGEGTGLGLSTVYGIISELKGGIDIESEVGKGTTFKIYLPTTSRAPIHTDSITLTRSEIAAAGASVLVVEDEGIVLDLVLTVLRSNGYSVTAATNAEEALAIFGEKPDFDLVVTDVVMPGRSGRLLGEELSRRRPELPILYMSGYTDDTVLKHGISSAEHSFLQKPFTAAAILRAVSELLTKARDTADR
jgi:signal transduction histidine kinase/ActR/RegA family two-component response regulator